jgi:hypothetical protein
MAQRAVDSMPAVADVLFRAATTRGDDTAKYAAFHAWWELPESEQWRSSVATARGVV